MRVYWSAAFDCLQCALERRHSLFPPQTIKAACGVVIEMELESYATDDAMKAQAVV
jgi:hypothetical protein